MTLGWLRSTRLETEYLPDTGASPERLRRYGSEARQPGEGIADPLGTGCSASSRILFLWHPDLHSAWGMARRAIPRMRHQCTVATPYSAGCVSQSSVKVIPTQTATHVAPIPLCGPNSPPPTVNTGRSVATPLHYQMAVEHALRRDAINEVGTRGGRQQKRIPPCS